MSYLDPSILRLAKQPAPERGNRETLRVPDRELADFRPGQRIETSSSDANLATRTMTINTRMATVVSWDRDSGELVVEYDAPRAPEIDWSWFEYATNPCDGTRPIVSRDAAMKILRGVS